MLSSITSEALSLHLPPGTRFIAASGHTWRMYREPMLDRETSFTKVNGEGIQGYLWGMTCLTNEELPHGEFRYQKSRDFQSATHSMSLGGEMAENAKVTELHLVVPIVEELDNGLGDL